MTLSPDDSALDEAAFALKTDQLAYWRSRGARQSERNALLDTLRWRAPRVGGNQWATLDGALPAPASANVLRICKGSDLSLYILLVAMLKAYTARTTGEESPGVLSPGYSADATASPGQTVILEDHVARTADMRAVILETRRTVSEAYSNQAVSLAEIYGARQTADILANTPLCALSAIHAPNAGRRQAAFELWFARVGARISWSIHFDTGRFRPDLVAQFSTNLERFIVAASADYSRSLDELDLLSDAGRKCVSAFSKGPVIPPPEVRLDSLISAQARKTPEEYALISGGRTLSYGALDTQSDQVSASLQAVGIGPGNTVALRMPTGIDVVVAMLGVLKAGAAFAPISLNEPPNRLHRFLETSRADLLVTAQPEAVAIPGRQTLIFSQLPRADGSPPHPAGAVDDPAYVILTSGTTGAPKPVVIDHRGIVNAVTWKHRTYGFSAATRVLPLFGHAFDGFVLNLFAPLCTGAAVVLLDDEDRRTPARIARSIEADGVTHIVCAPLLYRATLDQATDFSLSTLDTVTLAGEAADHALIARSKAILPSARLANEYGPAENSVVSTYSADLTPETVRVIGRPIANVAIHILDERRRPQPPGVIGEVYLAGPGLARGYAPGPGALEMAFVELGGERLYRTGDLACWLPDGNVEYQGRRARYIKVRGARADPEEIRAALLTRGEVREAAVLIDGPTDHEMIYAFVVCRSQVSTTALASDLRDDLPAHLIPNRIVQIEALPLNAGGKVAHDALRAFIAQPTPDRARREVENAVAPDLIAIWQSVLEVDHVDPDDSFFALGGHSLRAVRLLTQIHENFGVELKLNEIYESSTVRRLAQVIARQRHKEPPPQLDWVAPARGSAEGEAILSAAQERMLALTSEHPVAYNLPVLFTLSSNLDVGRLQHALNTVLSRHPVLRATFHPNGDRWVQRFDRTARVQVGERQIVPGTDFGTAARTAVEPFDLQRGPLLRVVLFSEGAQHRLLLLDFHHIVIDEVSLEIVLREFAKVYNGEPLWEASSYRYADYARVQQNERSSAGYRTELAEAVRKVQGGEIEPLRLPFDRPAPRRRTDDGGLVRMEFPNGFVAAIRALCAKAEITDFTFFLAAFGLLLHKHTQQTRMVIGAPVSMRSGPLTDTCVGLFLNTVPFRLDVPRNASFKDYLAAVKAEILEGLGRSRVEFGDLVKALGTERGFAENPLFSVLLNMVDSAVTTLRLDGVEARYSPLHTGTAKFDLVLELNLGDGPGSFALEFPTQRFEADTIRRMGDSFVALLADAMERPEAPISSLHAISETDRAQVFAWGRVHDDVGPHDAGSPASLFEGHAQERPSSIAIVHGDATVTYAELNARSNRLARKLVALGVGENDVVGVFCERSPKVIVAILAVQKAGAAHLPLDPHYPAIRTGKMLSDSGAKILITDLDISALGFDGTVVHLEEDFSAFDPTDLRLARRPESLAYVLYTSGTTGNPKGVAIAQRNLVTLVCTVTRMLGLDHRDVWTLFHSVCFDVSVWEMFGALLTGARLVIVPREQAADATRLLALIEDNGVTFHCQPPSAFYLLADAMLRAKRATALRYIILGGEAVKPENLSGWHDNMPTIINGYGITETTVYSTFHVFSRRGILERTRSIGRPLPGTYVYILDEGMSVCPIGVVGELYIGGLGVGAGYLDRPDLTRQRFIEDPFRPGQLLYRSGDLVRWRPGGEIEYLGRADKQLKVRGYRIETSEIEAAMTAYSQVRESVVLIETRDTRTQLVGFFTSNTREQSAHMRDHLAKHLPDYMVPARLVQVEQMPLTPNGKVNQARLLETPIAAPEPENRAPRSALETLLAATWADIIGIPADDIGRDDSFFTLGGDSIGANLVVKQLEKRKLPVELLDLFEHPKLRDFAGLIEARMSEKAGGGSAERPSYWDAVRATTAAPLLPTLDQGAAGAGHVAKASVSVPLGEPLPAGGTISLHDIMLTTLSVALRMWSGSPSIRIALLSDGGPDRLDGAEGGAIAVAPAVVTIDDVHRGQDNLAMVQERAHRAAEHMLDWNVALGDASLRDALAGSAVFRFRDSAPLEGAAPPLLDLSRLPPGCIHVTCALDTNTATVEFAAPGSENVQGRLRFLAETFKLALPEVLRTLPKAAAPAAPAKVNLDVEPFSDVFFQDCTNQAILAAVRHFGGDIDPLLSVTAGICVRDVGRSCGLRVAVKYVESHPFDGLLADTGITVQRSTASEDICGDLVNGLSQGALGIVKLDCYFVERHHDLYKTRHGDHTVLVCGFDRDRRSFDIIDNEPGRNILYRRTTIGFDELRAAYEGYQHLFNADGKDASGLYVSVEPGRQLARPDPGRARRLVLDTLRLARSWCDEEAAAFDLLHDDFRTASEIQAELSEHAERLSFTIGEILLAKRLLAYQLNRVLENEDLARPVTEIISRLAVVLGVLTKLRVSETHSINKVRAMRARLAEIRELHLEYADAVGRLLED